MRLKIAQSDDLCETKSMNAKVLLSSLLIIVFSIWNAANWCILLGVMDKWRTCRKSCPSWRPPKLRIQPGFWLKSTEADSVWRMIWTVSNFRFSSRFAPSGWSRYKTGFDKCVLMQKTAAYMSWDRTCNMQMHQCNVQATSIACIKILALCCWPFLVTEQVLLHRVMVFITFRARMEFIRHTPSPSVRLQARHTSLRNILTLNQVQ